MSSFDEPLVSLVIPVFNGEKYLSECIGSVMHQTYRNWELVVVDNCSTDRTLEIANAYAEKESRIRVVSCREFLKQIPNFNRAADQISPDSAYCCVMMADDCLYPGSILKKVELGEKYPSAGVISSYRSDGANVGLKGLPPEQHFFKGRDIARAYFIERRDYFGSTTGLLLRTSLVNECKPLFDENEIHADTDLVLRLLRKCDFAMVHELLSFVRRHEGSTSSFCDLYGTSQLFQLGALKKYGRDFLSSEELERAERIFTFNHSRFLVRRVFSTHRRDIWRYNRLRLEKLGFSLRRSIILKASIAELFSFRRPVNWVVKKISRRRNRAISEKDLDFKRNTTV